MSDLQALDQARWIWTDDDPDQTNVWAYFRRTFEARRPQDDNADDDAWLYITADLRYVVWINGVLLGFGPPKYHLTTPTVDRYPLGRLLSPTGTNVICALVYSLGHVSDISSCMPRRGALLGAIETDGGRTRIVTDRTWRARRERAYLASAVRRGEFQPHNEVFDAQASLGEPWRRDYDDAGWPQATELSTSPALEPWERLEARDIPLMLWTIRPPLRVIETGRARYSAQAEIQDVARQLADAHRGPTNRVTIADGADGAVELDAKSLPADQGCYCRWDFGQILTGYPAIEIEGKAGTIVDLSYAEHLNSDGKLDPSKHGLHYFDRLILGDRPLRHRIMWPKCLRHLQADVRGDGGGGGGGGGRARITNITLHDSAYPVEYRGGFRSASATLDHAWQIAARTLALCMEDNYMDTPWRERGSWLGDIVPQAHGNYYAFGDAALHRRFLIHQSRGQMHDGRLRSKYPGFGENHIPTWTLTYPITLEHYVRHTGDAALAGQLLPTVERVARWLETYRTSEGVYGDFPIRVTETCNHYVFIDWSPVNTAGANAALNAFACEFYRSAERLARRCGQASAADRYGERADALARRFGELFFDPARGVFVNGRQNGRQHRRWGAQENYLAIVFGLADAEQRRSIVARLSREDLLAHFVPDPKDYDRPYPYWAIAVNEYRWDDERMVPLGTPYFAYWATQALCELGMHRQAIALIARHWGNFLRQGATTTWEQWDDGGSHSHGWGTAPIIVAGKYILGVAPGANDPRQVEIFPARGDLTHAAGRVPVVGGGQVQVSWRWQDGWDVDLTIPPGCSAIFGLPESETAGGLRLNGSPAAANTMLVNRPTGAHVALALQSGRHRIQGMPRRLSNSTPTERQSVE